MKIQRVSSAVKWEIDLGIILLKKLQSYLKIEAIQNFISSPDGSDSSYGKAKQVSHAIKDFATHFVQT